MEVQNRKPLRFTEVIYYDGKSLDPLEIFIKSGLTHVCEATSTGAGRIGASFREIPSTTLSQARDLSGKLENAGLGGILTIGKPNQPLLGFPVQEGRTGLIVNGGLNPLAAVEESGIPTHNVALSQLFPFEKLVHFTELSGSLA